ncbi:hypothetical protein LTR49_026851 [Elasticomyces elasticus]|nr:hypothetical protein LTR49_026851 [Elasticomyces elasticus]
MTTKEPNLPYTHKIIKFPDMKKKAYESINPNDHVPAIEDLNTSITLYEAGTIIESLMETYDKQHNISFVPGLKEFFKAKQWLYYQASGQGQYFGRAVWFTIYPQPKKLHSVIDRHVDEVRRASGGLNRTL